MRTQPLPYHYAAIDVYGWACSCDAEKAIANRDSDTGDSTHTMNLFFVPLPDEGSEYQFEWYTPQVPGAFVVRERDKHGNWTYRNGDDHLAAITALVKEDNAAAIAGFDNGSQ